MDMPPPPPRGSRAGSDLLRSALQRASAGQGAQGDVKPAEQDGAARLALPLPWENYFDSRFLVVCPGRRATFNVYQAGGSGPVVLCLHGGGYTGLSWALFAQYLKDRYRVVAPDLRGHGLTTSAADADFAATTLAADVVAIWRALYATPGSSPSGDGVGGDEEARDSAAAGETADPPPPIVIVGHSMGGAVAVRAAALDEILGLAGVVVVDVVEGTALASLPFMDAVLAGRPARFGSLEEAVEWAMATGMCRRREAAHISLPAMLREAREEGAAGTSASPAAEGAQQEEEEGPVGAAAASEQGLGPLEPVSEEGEMEEMATGEAAAAAAAAAAHPVATGSSSCGQGSAPSAGSSGGGSSATSVAAEQQPGGGAARGQLPLPRPGGGEGTAGGGWVWRTPLRRSCKYWDGWYRGLSETFLKLKVPKVLILAGTDRLDRQLTIGQMQGRFQLLLLPQAGHAVHEDEPQRTAEAVATFLKRFRVGEPPLALPRAALGMPPVLPLAAGPPA